MNLSEIKSLDSQHFLQVFGERTPVCFVRGEGCTLYDQDGKGYTDLFSGIAVNALGYHHPVVTKAIIDQAEAGVLHTSNLYYVEPQAKLAQLLCDDLKAAPLDVHRFHCPAFLSRHFLTNRRAASGAPGKYRCGNPA